jgi:hypothetical protein
LVGSRFDVELGNIEPGYYEDVAKEYLDRIRDSKKVTITDGECKYILGIINNLGNLMIEQKTPWNIGQLIAIERKFFS